MRKSNLGAISTVSLITAIAVYFVFKNFVTYSQDLEIYAVADPHVTASSLFVEGKLKEGACFEYAKNLQNRLYFLHGVHSDFLFFEWEKDGTNGTHVVCKYYIGNDVFAIDNQRILAICVTGKSNMEIAQMFSVENLKITILKNNSDIYR
ncbi:MAG: hypothetical protein HXY23_14760 [Parvularculaceae bacterium]|nr:hypothetical protein [Parvularculaceae bacterium]